MKTTFLGRVLVSRWFFVGNDSARGCIGVFKPGSREKKRMIDQLKDMYRDGKRGYRGWLDE